MAAVAGGTTRAGQELGTLRQETAPFASRFFSLFQEIRIFLVVFGPSRQVPPIPAEHPPWDAWLEGPRVLCAQEGVPRRGCPGGDARGAGSGETSPGAGSQKGPFAATHLCGLQPPLLLQGPSLRVSPLPRIFSLLDSCPLGTGWAPALAQQPEPVPCGQHCTETPGVIPLFWTVSPAAPLRWCLPPAAPDTQPGRPAARALAWLCAGVTREPSPAQ